MKKTSNLTEKFGSYIRRLRINNDIGQRELAKKIGIAPSYLNDIEKKLTLILKIKIINLNQKQTKKLKMLKKKLKR